MKERNESGTGRGFLGCGGKGSFWINFLGILSALVIAFGGFALMQKQLTAERQKLLGSSGYVEVLTAGQLIEEEALGAVESTRPDLTLQELIRALEVLENQEEIYPHEPQPGQLSMAGAVEYGREWLEDFLLPRLEIPSDSEGVEWAYRTPCFLWTKGENSRNEAEDPVLSYWTISFVSQEINAVLVLNAVTGQVLDAAISSAYPVEYQEDYDMLKLLEDYTNSFGLEADYSIFGKEADHTWTIDRGYGDREIASTVSISSLAVASPNYTYYDEDTYLVTAREYVMIRFSMEAAHRPIDIIP